MIERRILRPHSTGTRFAYSLIVCLLSFAAFVAVLAAGTASASSTHQSPPPAVPLTSTLVINEVYDSSNPANEYMELYNASFTTAEPLTAYTIHNSDASGNTNLSTLTTSLQLLQPRQYVAIGPAQFSPPRTTLVGDGFSGSDYLALSNTGAETPPVDIVNWGQSPNPSWNLFSQFSPYFFFTNIPQMPAPDGPNSLSRYPNGVDTDTPSDWRSLPASAGFPNPAPTPGAGTTTPSVTPTVGCEDRYEPDNSASQARRLELGTDQVHTICRSNGGVADQDWTVFNALPNKVYTMQTKELTAPVDTMITLYDSSLNVLAFNDDYAPGQGLASRIDYTFSVTGTFYLQVRDPHSSGGLGYQYTLSLTSTGAVATVTPTANILTPVPGACYDAYEPDGVPESAKLFLIGTSQHHTICPIADSDWERFFAAAGKVYTLKTLNLGVGMDTYMYLLDSNARTVLSENDDGGDGVASRIDFYPVRDDWYYIQIKNKGDIGGPEQMYDLSLAVQPGVPQPPGTATAIIAPPVTGTAVATKAPGPTQPPVLTPTQGAVPPTPTARPTTLAQPAPTLPSKEVPTAEPGEPTPVVPGPPNTGYKPSQPQARPLNTASILFRVFYDGNANKAFDKGESIRGLTVYFRNDSESLLSGGLVTTLEGQDKMRIPTTSQRVFIPYLGINMPLKAFPDRELHWLWLPARTLPNSVP